MWALIQNGFVIEITDVDPSGRFHPDFIWIPCGPDVSVGFSYSDGKFTAPEPSVGVPHKVIEVSRSQGKAALINAGLWPSVLLYVAGIQDEKQKLLAEVALNDTVSWMRDSEFLASAAEFLGISEEGIDTLFSEASKISF